MAIPVGYGEDRLVLMVKDPWWLFAYWEIRPETERAARHQLLPHEVAGLTTVLRVYDVTGVDFPRQPAHRHTDIGLSGLATNWYVHTDAPDRDFLVEIGLLTRTGRFLLLARSNRVRTPRFGPSETIDEAWAVTDEQYWKLARSIVDIGMGASAGFSGEGWLRWLAKAPSSAHWASGSLFIQGRPPVMQGVWCRVATELILYGSTDPNARVAVQGRPVTVRKDGTFSLRFALPEGTQALTIDVTAPDGRQINAVHPIITLARAETAPPVTGADKAQPQGPGGGSRGTSPAPSPVPSTRPAIHEPRSTNPMGPTHAA